MKRTRVKYRYISLCKRLPKKLSVHLLKWVAKKEGGEWQSPTLRVYYKIFHHIDVGFGSYGCFFINNFQGNCTIGNYCSIADTIRRFNGNHPVKECIMHPIYYAKEFGGNSVNDIERKHLTIGHGVWIGSDTVILAGCERIGNGAVIGAGSIVTKDVPPYAIVVGNPARVIKKRFSIEEEMYLEQSRWWELSPAQLMEFYSYRQNPIQFSKAIIEKYRSEVREDKRIG